MLGRPGAPSEPSRYRAAMNQASDVAIEFTNGNRKAVRIEIPAQEPAGKVEWLQERVDRGGALVVVFDGRAVVVNLHTVSWMELLGQ